MCCLSLLLVVLRLDLILILLLHQHHIPFLTSVQLPPNQTQDLRYNHQTGNKKHPQPTTPSRTPLIRPLPSPTPLPLRNLHPMHLPHMLDHLILPRKPISAPPMTPLHETIDQLRALAVVHVLVVPLQVGVACAGVGAVLPEAEVGAGAAGMGVSKGGLGRGEMGGLTLWVLAGFGSRGCLSGIAGRWSKRMRG